MMKFKPWTLGLAAAGVVSLASAVRAEEAPNQVLTALSSTTLSGYVDTSAIWKPGTGNVALPGRVFDGPDKVDGFNLHVVELTLEKPLDESQWSAGYRVDLLFGPDANYYAATLNSSPTGVAGVGGGDDFSIKQAYVALRAPLGNGLDIKVGVWDTIIGYEVFESANNPNFSRSYGFGLEPTHHTGVLLSYQLNDMISISGGVANTHSAIRLTPTFGAVNTRSIRSETHKTYMGSVTLTAPDSWGVLAGSSFYAGIVDGFAGEPGAFNPKDATSLYAGATIPTPIEGLSIGGAWDFREDGLNPLSPNPNNWAWAAAAYASYQATEKLRFNARGDWTRGSDGTFYDGGTPFVSDDKNELFSVTLTADYALWDNVLTRLEGRWDHSSDKAFGGTAPFGIGGSDPDRNAFTLALNVVYKF